MIAVLQRQGILKSKITPEKEKILTKFLHDPKPHYPFRDQPRFKFWIGSGLDIMVFRNIKKLKQPSEYLRAVEMARDDIDGFLREPSVVEMICKQVTENKIFDMPTKTPSPKPTPTPSQPASSVPTP